MPRKEMTDVEKLNFELAARIRDLKTSDVHHREQLQVLKSQHEAAIIGVDGVLDEALKDFTTKLRDLGDAVGRMLTENLNQLNKQIADFGIPELPETEEDETLR